MSDKIASIQNFDNMTERQKEVFIEAGLHYQGEYLRARKATDGISATAAFHKLIDESVAKPGEYTASCSKGCSFCCYIHNEITWDEAQLLIEYAADEKIEIDMDLLKRQQGKTLEDYKTMKAVDRRCTFLSSQGECKVYKHRPATCRKYLVISKPELCDMDGNKTQDVSVIINNEVEVMFSGMGIAAEKTGLMADLLIQKLNEQGTKTTEEAT